MKRKLTIVFIIILIAAAAAMFFGYLGGMKEASADLAGAVEVAKKVEAKETTVKIFFGNKIMNQNPGDCKVVFPVERTVSGDLIVKRRTMEEILLGPTAQEIQAGYFSALPSKEEVINYREKIKGETGAAPYDGDEILLKGVKISIGMIYADFSKEIFAISGDDCRIQLLKAQLSQTAKQFPKVGGTIITVGGMEKIF